MLNRHLHPVTRLLVWLLALIAVQNLQGAWLAGVCLVSIFSNRTVVRRGGRLVWRVRWFLLSIFFLFSWGVAGEPLWLGEAAPTIEGLHLAFTHLGRLFLVLMTLAAFLESMSLSEMLSAMHHLLRPLGQVGLDSDRGVIRLMLVLRYFESLPRPRDWRNLLDAPESAETEYVDVDIHPMRWHDVAVTVVLSALCACYFALSR